MNLAISNKSKATVKYQHDLLNCKGEDVSLVPNESVTALFVIDSQGIPYYGIQKKTKGLILLSTSLYPTFNIFKENI